MMVDTSEPIKNLEDLMRWADIVARQHPGKLHVFFMLSLNTGLFASDLRSLRWKDFFPSKNETRNFIEKSYDPNLVGVKKIMLDSKTMDILRSLRKQHPKDNYVFQTERVARAGAIPVSAVHLMSFLQKSAKEVGLQERIGSATLRKSLGYHLVTSGAWTLDRLSSYFAHRSPRYTAEYCDLPYDDAEEDGIVVPALIQ